MERSGVSDMTPAKKKQAFPDEEFLANEIFNRVQDGQEAFSVSDGECFDTADELFESIRKRLLRARAAVRKMEAWLRKYDERACDVRARRRRLRRLHREQA